MKCDPAAIADLFTSVGRSGVCDDFATLFNAEQTSGATTVGVTKFLGFPQVCEETGVVLGIELCRDIDDLVLSIAKHDILQRKGGQPQDVTDLMYYIKLDGFDASYRLR